jgi:hypothetical protein
LEAVVRLVQAVVFVEAAPEAVVHAVGAHFHHYHQVPVGLFGPAARHLEALLGHCADLLEQPFLVFSAEALHIQHVAAGDGFDLLL